MIFCNLFYYFQWRQRLYIGCAENRQFYYVYNNYDGLSQQIQRQLQNYPQLLLIMENNKLYIWLDLVNLETKTQIQLPQKLQEVSVGEKHIIIRTDSKLYGFGENSKGQLGNDGNSQQKFAQLSIRTINHPIKQISCGWNHTLILDELGNVFSSGEGKYGALGYARGIDSFSFLPVPNIKNIKYISAGQDHSLALSSIKVYGWGNSMDGQLGIPKQKIWYEPQQLFIYPSKICYAGSKYSLFVTQKGVYGTGQNDEGQLGLGNKIKVRIPKKIAQFKQQICEVGGSSKYSIFKTVQNTLYISGTGCFGQYLYPTKIKYLNNCSSFALGEKYGLIKTIQGSIQVWDCNKEQILNNNTWLNNLSQPIFYAGPKMIVCNAINLVNAGSSKNQISLRIHRNYGLVARSSIQYNDSKQLSQSNIKLDQQINDKEKKIRKKSQNRSKNKFDFQDCRLSEIANNNQEESIQHHNSHLYSRLSRQQQEPNQKNRYFPEQVCSPHFKKESLNNSSSIRQYNQNYGSDRISELKNVEQSQIRKVYNQEQKNKYIVSASGSLLVYSQDTNPLFSKSKSIQKLSKIHELQFSDPEVNGYDNDIKQRLEYLEKQNRKKDQCIRKMRRQLLDLIQVVQSDACLKQITEQKNKDYLPKRKKQLLQGLQPQNDIFLTNAEKLRSILGRTVNSLTFS